MRAPSLVIFRNFIAKIRYLWARLSKDLFSLNSRNWKWISAASGILILIFVAGDLFFNRGALNFWWMIIAGLLTVAFPVMYGLLIKIGLMFARKIPVRVSWLVFAAGALFFLNFSASLKGIILLLFYFLLTFIFIAGALSNISDQGWKLFSRPKKLVNIFFLCIGISNLVVAVYFLSYPGKEPERSCNAGLEASCIVEQIALEDPSLPGEYSFSAFTYGSGVDKHRAEFGEDVGVVSGTVDGSKFLEGWDRLPGKLRTSFWGFGPDELPLNGRVWMPEGAGTFPVIMIVHGNHFDRDYSDSGYAYLGEQLASHGYITVSVDENFLNHGLTDFNHSLEEENDARGWLLLKHLELLRIWNSDSTSEYYGKIDTEQVVLIGHSRGGEAVCIAASFNKLKYYPDDASETFNFNFGIRGIVAIAQVDGQYQPENRPTPLSDLNYLSLQGSMDADLNSYMGLAQYNRIRFSDSSYHFKAGLYIQDANHGQFNSSWGVNDAGYPHGMLLNRKGLLNAYDQQKVALVYITSFVEATLGELEGYIGLFRDYRSGRKWLPETGYINQFADNRVLLVADFEEDIDLLTTSYGSRSFVEFSGLATLYEVENELRKAKLGSKTLVLGWNNTEAEAPGYYSIHFDQPIDMTVLSLRSLQFDVAVLDQFPGERMNDETGKDDMYSVKPGEGKSKIQKDKSREQSGNLLARNSGEIVKKESGSNKDSSGSIDELIDEQQQVQKQVLQEERQNQQEKIQQDEPQDEQKTIQRVEQPGEQKQVQQEELQEEQDEKQNEVLQEEPEEEQEEQQTAQKDELQNRQTDIQTREQLTEQDIGDQFGTIVDSTDDSSWQEEAEAIKEKKADMIEDQREEDLHEKKEVKISSYTADETSEQGEQQVSGGDKQELRVKDGNEEPVADSETTESDEPEWYEMREDEPGDVGFSIVLTDRDGNSATVAVSDHFPLGYPEVTSLLKLRIFNGDQDPEPVPQHVEINLEYFFAANPAFDRENLSSVTFVFDRAPDGMVSIDNIGFTNY